ncbi:cytochrome c oxidase assembly protein COX20, mitochondrial [Centruroides vittatus]|uniref:cytochrome c oxidase assembly protein COX20, mitochondrial n=1 Tax=Centruroides vittatus TaxID=120091 RepID=UPI00350EA0ED
MEDDSGSRKFSLFGRNLAEVPCFKRCFTTGILSGLGVGTGYFLFTSRPKRSADLGVLTFTVVTLGYWFFCRYDYSKKRFQMAQLKKGLQTSVLLEGTEKDFLHSDKNQK